MLKADFHMHTNLCDGKNTPEEMVIAAIDIGLKHMGFSGHFDPENGVHMETEEYLKEIKRIKEKYKDKIDILLDDGSLLWQSGLLKPGYKITKIRLLKDIDEKTCQDATIKYDCFSMNKALTALNSAKVKLRLAINKQ